MVWHCRYGIPTIHLNKKLKLLIKGSNPDLFWKRFLLQIQQFYSIFQIHPVRLKFLGSYFISQYLSFWCPHRYFFCDPMDWINISGARLITEADDDTYLFDGSWNLDFKIFFFGRKRLYARVPQNTELLGWAVNHVIVQRVARLGHIDP